VHRSIEERQCVGGILGMLVSHHFTCFYECVFDVRMYPPGVPGTEYASQLYSCMYVCSLEVFSLLGESEARHLRVHYCLHNCVQPFNRKPRNRVRGTTHHAEHVVQQAVLLYGSTNLTRLH
jgi:hypothetical protein